MHSLTIPVSIVLNTWVQLHNSVWTGAMNRTPTPTECMLRLLRTPNVYPRTRNIYPRTPIMICGCIYTIRHETGAMNRSPTPTECMLRLFMRNQCLFHEYMIFVLVHPL